MTTQPKKPETKPADEPIRLPGPPLCGTRYACVVPYERVGQGLTSIVAVGRAYENALNLSGVVDSIYNMGSGITRVVIRVGDGVFGYADFWGQWAGAVEERGARFHEPKLVSPEVTEARKALLALDPKAREEVMAGFGPNAA